ncbi:MAG TPA: hypothetical protein VM262_21260, partial [Acidimicrobiales bacterium]|nr:hypothetical protein [Acidimicrobiales bacterium]
MRAAIVVGALGLWVGTTLLLSQLRWFARESEDLAGPDPAQGHEPDPGSHEHLARRGGEAGATVADRQPDDGHAKRDRQGEPPGEAGARLPGVGVLAALQVEDAIVDEGGQAPVDVVDVRLDPLAGVVEHSLEHRPHQE